MIVVLLSQFRDTLPDKILEQVADIAARYAVPDDKCYFYSEHIVLHHLAPTKLAEAFARLMPDTTCEIMHPIEVQQYVYLNDKWDAELYETRAHLKVNIDMLPYSAYQATEMMVDNADVLIARIEHLDKLAYII